MYTRRSTLIPSHLTPKNLTLNATEASMNERSLLSLRDDP